MRLKKLILKNFRGYKGLTLDLRDDMNVIIGKNDIGKSTIMEALEIFFNGDSRQALVKAEIEDCNIHCSEKEMTIGACFELENGERIIMDSTNPTDLKEEYLLNKDGYLEIYKVWNCSKAKLTASNLKIYINAYYPNVFDKDLITMNNTNLKKMLSKIEDKIEKNDLNKTVNASIRKALYNCYIDEKTQFSERLIDTKKIDTDAKNIWDKLKDYFPLYFLFQSDRVNSDSDSEVQNPLKIATKKALDDIKDKLEDVEKYVDKKVSKIGKETIAKLKELDPEIAKKLKINLDFKSPWSSIFKYDLESDDGIPLNKRGSGVKRLILLSYFRAEAERVSKECNKNNIIYAIEEPETSQHPNFQTMIMESLVEIGEDKKHQMIITTHTPEIAKMVDKDSLILIDRNEFKEPILITDENVRLRNISNTLGLLPEYNTKVLVCVEGKNDVNFLKNLNRIQELRDVVNLENELITIIPMQGSNLKQWIKYDYLRKFNDIKEIHIYDRDRRDYIDKIKQINEASDGRRLGFNTKLYEMENYICPKLIEKVFKEKRRLEVDLSDYYTEWHEKDVPKLLEEVYELREAEIKSFLNGVVAKNITKEILEEHGVYDEVYTWFENIANMVE
ncbi:ATP-binding protein [Dethiothermospora halolimnae]|uniref:ATP-binding protein n=1 Tax=Dethiothermospora halolimnae TaxID=3114390 RepID=UPI003CCBF251